MSPVSFVVFNNAVTVGQKLVQYSVHIDTPTYCVPRRQPSRYSAYDAASQAVLGNVQCRGPRRVLRWVFRETPDLRLPAWTPRYAGAANERLG
jgi:hypothetical protein